MIVRALVVVAALAAAVSPLVTDDPEAEAAELLEKAEEQVSKGQHKQAVGTYKKIVKKYADTAAGSIAARRNLPSAYLGKTDVLRHGPSENRVDVVLMGDGYEVGDLKGYGKIVADVPDVFERDRVYGEYFEYLNIIRADVVSEEDGIDAFGREFKTALGGAMSGGEQGQVTVDRGAVRKILREELPEADGFAITLVRKGELGTGGGGVAAVAARQFDTLIHEWGHAFSNLKDEYSTNTGFRGETTSAINVSSTEDPEKVPWAHFIKEKVRGIGVYEGADGKVRGAWKPTSSGCTMGSGEFFCAVCREAIVLRIHEFVDPIDSAIPDVGGDPIRITRDGEKVRFTVQVMRPSSHKLEVSWWLFPAAAAPVAAPYTPDHAAQGERTSRGRLSPIETKPEEFGRNAKNGIYKFDVKPRDLAPGEYVVFVRAEDKTELRGERWPWVLKDDQELLKSERTWKVVVE